MPAPDFEQRLVDNFMRVREDRGPHFVGKGHRLRGDPCASVPPGGALAFPHMAIGGRGISRKECGILRRWTSASAQCSYPYELCRSGQTRAFVGAVHGGDMPITLENPQI